MNYPKPKFPLLLLIIINVAWWIIVFIGITYMLNYALYYNTHLDISILATIGTIIVAAALVTTNTILVAITKTYTDQTARMAKETAKMAEGTKKIVDHYYQTRKENLKPIFVPGSELLSRVEELYHFVFTNVGNTALFVWTHMEKKKEKSSTFKQIVPKYEKIGCGIFKLGEKFSTTLYIYFSDASANKYLQTVKFNSEWGYKFDESALPVEQTEIPSWVKPLYKESPDEIETHRLGEK